jgi:endonuclease/exonuclease/phosphatase family metal-dependent hydrolase
MRLVMASYNVHGFVGGDGRFDPERIGTVLRELDADVIALQEVQDGALEPHALDDLARAAGVHVVRGRTLDRTGGAYGNALLSRLPVEAVTRLDLSLPGREPRGAIDAAIATGAEPVRVLATHLGIGVRERRFQVRRLVAHLAAGAGGVRVLLGDMNEWVRGAGALAALHRVLGRTAGPRTFPASFPLFSLDRVWVHPRPRLRRMWVHRSAAARIASDHLPVAAELFLEPAAGSAQNVL